MIVFNVTNDENANMKNWINIGWSLLIWFLHHHFQRANWIIRLKVISLPVKIQDQILKLYWQPITATGSFDITFLTYPSRFIVMTDLSNVLDVRSRVSLILNCISDSLGSKSIHSQFSFLNWTMILVGSTTRLLFWAY